MTKKKKLTAADWLAKYYPVPADQVPARQVVQHSLQKWRGLRPAVLRRYGLRILDGDVYPEEPDGGVCVLRIHGVSCSLCARYYVHGVANSCTRCPLFQARGKAVCGSPTQWERSRNFESPWSRWTYDEDPEPMIRALERTLEYKKSKGTKKNKKART